MENPVQTNSLNQSWYLVLSGYEDLRVRLVCGFRVYQMCPMTERNVL